jgi:hypothetical protein
MPQTVYTQHCLTDNAYMLVACLLTSHPWQPQWGQPFSLLYTAWSCLIVIYFTFTCHVFAFLALMYLDSFSHVKAVLALKGVMCTSIQLSSSGLPFPACPRLVVPSIVHFKVLWPSSLVEKFPGLFPRVCFSAPRHTTR